MRNALKVYENKGAVAVCGVEPNDAKPFETVGGVAVDKEVRARINDGFLVEVKPAKEESKNTVTEKKG